MDMDTSAVKKKMDSDAQLTDTQIDPAMQIADGPIQSVYVKMTDNNYAIVVTHDLGWAAFTADEARRLAVEIDRRDDVWYREPVDLKDALCNKADMIDDGLTPLDSGITQDERGYHYQLSK